MYANRRDANQGTVQRAFERLGCEVLDLSGVGRGCGDLLVLYRDRIRMVEVKNPATGYGRKGLNKNQKKLAARRWPIEIARTEAEAEALCQKWSEE